MSWADYFQDVPQGGSFRPFGPTLIDPHFLPFPVFLAQAALGELPQVSFVDPSFGLLGTATEKRRRQISARSAAAQLSRWCPSIPGTSAARGSGTASAAARSRVASRRSR